MLSFRRKAGKPPARPSTIPGTKIPLVTVGHKGMYAAVLGLYGGPRLTVRYQRVTLDSRFDGSRDMKLLMTAYQEQLKNTGFAGLGLRPTPSPQFATNGRFVGSQKCESCHEKSYEIWKKSGHAHAYNTLAKLDPPRNFDPECVSPLHRRLESGQVLPLRKRLPKPGENPAPGQRRLRGLPRPRRETRGRRAIRQRSPAAATPQGHGAHQGRRQEDAMHLLSRLGQQHRVQIRSLLAFRRALREGPVRLSHFLQRRQHVIPRPGNVLPSDVLDQKRHFPIQIEQQAEKQRVVEHAPS